MKRCRTSPQMLPHFALDLLLLHLVLLIFIALPCAAAASYSEYHGMGIAFEHPAGWEMSTLGGNITGSVRIYDSCTNLTVSWMRNPGASSKSILEQLVKIYNQEEVAALLVEWDLTPVQGLNGQALQLSYEFQDHRAKKSFAAWPSNQSDRLFWASMQGCEEESARDAEVFNHLLETFGDQESKEVILESRGELEDSWSILIADLLSSHHYKEQNAIPPVSIFAEAVHTLYPNNGSYRLTSDEKIWCKMPDALAFRAAAVQQLLLQHGYNAKLLQKVGIIWVVIEDLGGRWQSISVNPQKPWMMVGVQAKGPDGYSGLIYENLADLAGDNLLTLEGSSQLGLYIEKDCDPSKYAELKPPAWKNQTWIDGLQKILDGYRYPESYRENIFDCSNTSQICWLVLQENGYDSRLLLSYKDHPLGNHMWVAVTYPYEEERYVAVETANTYQSGELAHMGKIVWKDEYYRGIIYNTSKQFSMLHREEGLWLEPRLMPLCSPASFSQEV